MGLVSLSRLADLEEENLLLRDQLVDAELERDEWKAQVGELKAQLAAKEENATSHTQIESRDGFVWQRTVVLIEMPWEKTHEVAT